MLAALSDSDQDRSNLLGAAQALAEATAKLLNASKPENIEVSRAIIMSIYVELLCDLFPICVILFSLSPFPFS